MNLFRFIRRVLLHLEVWLQLGLARFLIKFVAFRRWRLLLGPIDGEPTPEDWPELSVVQLEQASDIGRIVNRVGSRPILFKAICLPRAMTGRWTLARRGIPSRIVIGSRRGRESEEDVLFHAWLMVCDRVITGQEEREAFLELRKGKVPTGNG
ncbi:lasso peptide biosynthesis B2 protein [Aurantiacibacter sp. D1-12]|uniref:lasso peptide biosynthesis B2 protein n=1 Tax=Aurantiacibacter sp. D1-12 TaxID=2993658 RepID=UPI00237D15CF|nr:lasso peptide biosynthesis B2 protein [Aurantiacibacter sp. D1-12]MDE1466204.1 lasso peptide biosynthesis B2 protein [Aurantiacibacter sp. D1-12]